MLKHAAAREMHDVAQKPPRPRRAAVLIVDQAVHVALVHRRHQLRGRLHPHRPPAQKPRLAAECHGPPARPLLQRRQHEHPRKLQRLLPVLPRELLRIGQLHELAFHSPQGQRRQAGRAPQRVNRLRQQPPLRLRAAPRFPHVQVAQQRLVLLHHPIAIPRHLRAAHQRQPVQRMDIDVARHQLRRSAEVPVQPRSPVALLFFQQRVQAAGLDRAQVLDSAIHQSPRRSHVVNHTRGLRKRSPNRAPGAQAAHTAAAGAGLPFWSRRNSLIERSACRER